MLRSALETILIRYLKIHKNIEKDIYAKKAAEAAFS